MGKHWSVLPIIPNIDTKGTQRDGNKSAKDSPAVSTSPELQKMLKDLVDKTVKQSGKGHGKKWKKNQNCRRCQKTGHFAFECRAPAPVLENPPSDKSEKAEN